MRAVEHPALGRFELFLVPVGNGFRGLVDRGAELFRERERGRARAVDAHDCARKRGAHRRERPGERACPRELAARERGGGRGRI